MLNTSKCLMEEMIEHCEGKSRGKNKVPKEHGRGSYERLVELS